MPDGYVTIANYLTPLDAEVARLKLDAHEIPVYLADVHTASMSIFQGAAVGVRLQVPADLVEQARAILDAAPDQDTEDREPECDEPEAEIDFSERLERCPQCNSQKVQRQSEGNFLIFFMWLLSAASFFLFLNPDRLKYHWECLNCGHAWRAPWS